MSQQEFFTRYMLAQRWQCSERKVDRLRKEGLLPWIDLSAGKGLKPMVRFKIEDVVNFEKENHMGV